MGRKNVDFEKLIKFEQPKTTLKSQRVLYGYSQKFVADLLGLSVRQYQRYENGEKDIAEAPFQLGVAMCELLHIDIFDVVDHLTDLLKYHQDYDIELPGIFEK